MVVPESRLINASPILGPVDKGRQPEFCGSETDEWESSLVVARCDVTELLQPVERAFNAIEILVSLEVASDWLLAVPLGGMTNKILCIKSDERTSSLSNPVSLHHSFHAQKAQPVTSAISMNLCTHG